MKLPAFDHSKMEWDAWNAFHVVTSIICSSSSTPASLSCARTRGAQSTAVSTKILTSRSSVPTTTIARGLRPRYDVADPQVAPQSQGAADTAARPRSQASGGVLVPPDQGQCAAGPGAVYSTPTSLVLVWYAGPDAVPVGTPVMRHYPQPLTYDERKHINELVDACKVWLQMQPNPDALKKQHQK